MSFQVKRVGPALARWWRWDVARLWFNLTHLWSNEQGFELRTAREDLSHSYVNLFVELWRALSYLMGHILAVFLPWLLIALVWK